MAGIIKGNVFFITSNRYRRMVSVVSDVFGKTTWATVEHWEYIEETGQRQGILAIMQQASTHFLCFFSIPVYSKHTILT